MQLSLLLGLSATLEETLPANQVKVEHHLST